MSYDKSCNDTAQLNTFGFNLGDIMARMKGQRFKQCRRLNLNVNGIPKR
ncbi:hypothetical protein [Aminipila terrae]|nr:hypothetical protein [Aminipila terrae]